MKAAIREARFCLQWMERWAVLSVTGEIEHLLGFPAEAFLRGEVQLRERFHAHDSDIAELLFHPSLEDRSGSFNVRLRRADGRIRLIRGEFTRAANTNGSVSLELLLQDAKSLWREQDNLAPALNFSAMMEATDDYIYFKDRNHVFTGASQTLVRLTQPIEHWTELIGKTDYDVFPEEFADIYYTLEKDVFAGIPIAREIQETLTKDGVRGWIDNRKYPIRSATGEVVGLFGIARDISAQMRAEESLRKIDEMLHDAQEIGEVGCFDFDIVTGQWTSTAVLDSILGLSHVDSHTYVDWLALIHPEDRPEMERYVTDEVTGKGMRFNREYRIVRKNDGEVRWMHGVGRLDKDSNGKPFRMRGTIQDVTEHKAADDRLRLAASVFTNANESIVITSPEGAILDVNKAFTKITGYSREEVLGRDPKLLKSGRHSREFYAQMWDTLLSKGQWTGEIWNRTKDGRLLPEIETISAVRNEKNELQHYVSLAFDITPLKEHERKLEHFALYDPLTELPNRVFLAERMKLAMQHSRRHPEIVGVLFLDLDSFKIVNDNHGHDVGDQLLTLLAGRMKQVLRVDDTLARLGGDEFVAVLSDLSDAEASIPILERLLSVVCQPVRVGDLTLKVSASIGVTYYPQPEEVDADQLLRQADQAMYQAKLLGKNRYAFFDASVDRSIRGRYEEIERMRRGLQVGEFLLYYQPKVNMRSGAVIGVEALIRWQHPQRGLLSPGEFLPLIEEHGMAVKVGEWVIATALDQVRRWKQMGLEMPVSVNMGAHQLQQPDFVERLAELLSQYPEVAPSSLQLEVLETSALRDLHKTSDMLQRCVALGVSIALDDFGSGYSSLIYLKHLPAKILKIDRSFVSNILEDHEDLTILEGVLGLGYSFRRQCIAEGVETVEQGCMLLRLECELAQGFCIARPMPAEQLPAWIDNWEPYEEWQSVKPLTAEERRELREGSEVYSWLKICAWRPQ